jgi:hypothetical protein
MSGLMKQKVGLDIVCIECSGTIVKVYLNVKEYLVTMIASGKPEKWAIKTLKIED